MAFDAATRALKSDYEIGKKWALERAAADNKDTHNPVMWKGICPSHQLSCDPWRCKFHLADVPRQNSCKVYVQATVATYCDDQPSPAALLGSADMYVRVLILEKTSLALKTAQR
jgi:hypothetical protein